MTNKVDVMAAPRFFNSPDSEYISLSPDFAKTPATHPQYRREPYVRAQVPLATGGTVTIDAKVRGWTAEAVLIHWQEDDGRVHNVWLPSRNVARISREKSRWRDPYDLE